MMQQGTDHNALTEVALALVMAFFSIMILTIVGMATPASDAGASDVVASDVVASDAADRQDSPPEVDKKITAALAAAKGPGGERVSGDDRLIIYWRSKFFDADLKPVSPRALADAGDQRVILALPPTLTVAESLEARSKIPAAALIVTELNAAWLKRLETL